MAYSIIQKSQLERALRIDAEYFQPQYLDLENKLDTIKTISLGDISERIINFGAYSLCNFIEWQENGVPYLNVGDIKDGFIDYSNVKCISEKVHEILSKSAVREGDIVMPMAGSIGNVAVAENIPGELNSNQAIAKITLEKEFSPYFVAAFLGSKFGYTQIIREIVSSVQANIFLFQIKAFKIPIINHAKQLEIEKIYKDGLEKLSDSKNFYKQAENLLLEELGLKDFKLKNKLFSIVNFSDIQTANRVDPDFYQQKYFDLLEVLNKTQSAKLSSWGKRKNQIEKIYKEKIYNYIEISDINVSDGEYSSNEVLGSELPANAKHKLNGGELIISKVRPTRGAIALISENCSDNFIASGAFSIFNIESPMKEYLQIVLRSVVGKLQMERPTTGTSYPTITDQDVENLLIPILTKSTQQKIADLVCKSHSARQKSKDLLEQAKSKVEEMIEEKND